LLAHKQSVKHHNSAPTYFKKAHPQKPILPTSTIKMKGSGDVLQGHLTSEEDTSLAMPSSFYTANRGTGTFTTTSQPSFFGRTIISAQR
jgi:hypothetical protein